MYAAARISEWSASNICIPSRMALLRMLEAKHHRQAIVAGGALDLTFAKDSWLDG
jgi:hypothetical protein